MLPYINDFFLQTKRVSILLMMAKNVVPLVRDMVILVILVLMRVIMLLLMARQTCFVGICPWAKHHLSATLSNTSIQYASKHSSMLH